MATSFASLRWRLLAGRWALVRAGFEENSGWRLCFVVSSKDLSVDVRPDMAKPLLRYPAAVTNEVIFDPPWVLAPGSCLPLHCFSMNRSEFVLRSSDPLADRQH
ncbi:hypothetical protein [Paraburkholderia humisilvae]|uniref:hypothetical protein n=1 Tax=Paraburkholderia humisilvae TaxID=627669 RepID=UPI0015824632|nr:hypothetical protein [Paraburkholderia humisilvae]